MLSLSLSLSQSSLITNQENHTNANNIINNNNTKNILISPEDSNNNVFIIDTTNIPTKDGYIFLGYSRNSDASTLDYAYDSTSNTFTPSSVTINTPTTGDTSTLTLYTVWQDNRTLADITYMQDINSGICERSTLDQQYTLKDKRDNKTYTVAKLKMTPDGSETKCWMTQNLALELSTSVTLTNEDTDLNSVSSWTPERNTTITLSSSTFPNDSNNPYSYNPNNTSYGIYYNWTAAIASNDSSSLTTQYTNAPDSICPKGWRLPQIYGGSSTNRPNEFGNLLYAYSIINNAFPGDNQNAGWASNGYTKIQQAPINSSLAGRVYSGAVDYSGVNGNYWSSSVTSAASAYNLNFSTTVVRPQSYYSRNGGFSVRCILR